MYLQHMIYLYFLSLIFFFVPYQIMWPIYFYYFLFSEIRFNRSQNSVLRSIYLLYLVRFIWFFGLSGKNFRPLGKPDKSDLFLSFLACGFLIHFYTILLSHVFLFSSYSLTFITFFIILRTFYHYDKNINLIFIFRTEWTVSPARAPPGTLATVVKRT